MKQSIFNSQIEEYFYQWFAKKAEDYGDEEISGFRVYGEKNNIPEDLISWAENMKETIAFLNKPVEELDTSIRLTNLFRDYNIHYVYEILTKLSEGMQVRNVGPKTKRELRGLLFDYGLSLKATLGEQNDS